MSLMDKVKKQVKDGVANFFNPHKKQGMEMRIMGGPEVYMVHYTGKDFGTTKRTCLGHQCDICKNDPSNRPKQRVLFVILDRADDQIKWFEMGAAIYHQILELVALNHINLNTDDIVIKRNGGTPLTQYNVMPGRECKTTPEERTKFNDFMSKKIDKPKEIDICNKCGSTGAIKSTACVCDSCGNIIWGC